MSSVNIDSVVQNRLCVGCGLCVVVCPRQCIDLVWTRYRTWEPIIDTDSCSCCQACLLVCPHSPRNLLQTGNTVLTQGRFHGLVDEEKPHACFIGAAVCPEHRFGAASGGVLTLLLAELLRRGDVDAIIAAIPRPACIGEPHFGTAVCRTPSQVMNCASSVYGPLRYDHALKDIRARNEICAVTALPCIARGLRNLPLGWRRHFRFIFTPACSHNATDQLGDFMAHKNGVRQAQSFIISYRDKSGAPNANAYNTCFSFSDGHQLRSPRMHNGFTHVWRNNYFTPEACFYCPDFFSEASDCTAKDAWGIWSRDRRGTTMLISRHEHITSLIALTKARGLLQGKPCTINDILASQADTAIDKQERFPSRWSLHAQLSSLIHRSYLIQAYSSTCPSNIRSVLLTARFSRCLCATVPGLGLQFFTLFTSMTSLLRTAIGLSSPFAKHLLRPSFKMAGIIFRCTGKLRPVRPTDCRYRKHSGHRASLRRTKPAPTVLLAGGYGYGNAGDEAQLGANIARWRRVYPAAKLIALSPDPSTTTTLHQIDSTWASRVVWFDSQRNPDYNCSNSRFTKRFFRVRKRLLISASLLRAGLPIQLASPAESSVLDHLLRADVLHISGGGFLTGHTRSRLWDTCLLIQIAHLLGTPTLLTGQTIGLFRDTADRRIARQGLRHARHIFLRDSHESACEIRALGLDNSHIATAYDDAVFCEKASSDAVSHILRSLNIGSDDPYMVANFHFWGQTDSTRARTAERFAHLCDHAHRRHDCQTIFIPMHRSDLDPIKQVASLMSSKPAILDYDFDYRIARGIISGATACLTMKHHPIIFAYGEGVPVVAIALDDYYHRKNLGAMAHCGQEACMLGSEDFFSERALAVITDILKNREVHSHRILLWLNSIRAVESDLILPAMRETIGGFR